MDRMEETVLSPMMDLSYREDFFALFVNDQLYSHETIRFYVKRLANWLIINDIQCLGILASRSLEAYVGILATFYAGITYVPINPKLPIDRILSILQEIKFDALLIDKKNLSVQSINVNNIIGPEFFSDHCHHLAPLIKPADVNLDQTAYIIFTSGSTGIPKGIEVTYANVLHYIEVMQNRYQLNSDDRVAQYNELSFDLSLFDIMMAWKANASLYVIPESQLLSPAKFIQDHKITVWLSVPSIIHFMNKLKVLKKDSLPSLKWSLFCGEALLVEYAKSWAEAANNSSVENLYGPAELTISCLSYRFDPHLFNADSKQFVPIGMPNEGLFAAIIDEKHQFISQGRSGELVVAGPQVAKGYYKNLNLTQKKFLELTHPIYGQHRWYLTGDCCVQDLHGHYQYLGRIDNQHKILGHRIELEEIEYYLRLFSKTEEVVVVIVKNHHQINELIAVVCKNNLDVKELKNALRKKLPHYMIPNRIEIWPDLPRNLHGKINRKKVREQLTCLGKKSEII